MGTDRGFDGDEALRLQKHEALQRLSEVWSEALGDGIAPDILAHVALFAALRDLVDAYGEPAVADFATRLPERIAAGEFTVQGALN